jgi:hypothetical protein
VSRAARRLVEEFARARLLVADATSKRGIGLVVLSMGGERLDTRNPTSKLMLTTRNRSGN